MYVFASLGNKVDSTLQMHRNKQKKVLTFVSRYKKAYLRCQNVPELLFERFQLELQNKTLRTYC